MLVVEDIGGLLHKYNVAFIIFTYLRAKFDFKG